MPRISTYTPDVNVTKDDKLIGTDAGGGTKNFLIEDISRFIKETKISLPEDFLKRLMKLNSKEEISNEDLEKEYSNSENGIKYQLIEEKLLIENDIQIKIPHLSI